MPNSKMCKTDFTVKELLLSEGNTPMDIAIIWPASEEEHLVQPGRVQKTSRDNT